MTPQVENRPDGSPDRGAGTHNRELVPDFLAGILAATSVGVTHIDETGSIRFANSAFSGLLGFSSPSELVGKNIHDFLVRPAREEVSLVARPISSTLADGNVVHVRHEFCRPRNGSIFPVEYWSRPVSDGNTLSGAVITVLDARPRRGGKYRPQLCWEAVETALNAILFGTPQGAILYVNATAVALWGYEGPDDLIGKNVSILGINPAEQNKVLDRLLVCGKWHGQLTVQKKDRSRLETFLSASVICDRGGKDSYIVASFMDLTEQIEIEREIAKIEADERRRIGHDLHDDLGQLLTGLAMKTRFLRTNLGRDDAVNIRLTDEIALLIESAKSKVREAARGLSPIPPYDFGLVLALKRLTRETEAASGIVVALEGSTAANIADPETSRQIFRIVQEALNNAIRHAAATAILVRLLRTASHLEIQVRDNGKGIPACCAATEGMGLRIMRYRAYAINAVLALSSDPKHGGTLVSCSIPLRDGSEQCPDDSLTGLPEALHAGTLREPS